MEGFPARGTLWGAKIWDTSTIASEATYDSELSIDDKRNKAVIFSPDVLNQDRETNTVMLLHRTTHDGDTEEAWYRAKVWEVWDPRRQRPCEKRAVIDCMKIYRAFRDTGDLAYGDHGPVSRLEDSLGLKLEETEFRAVEELFAATIAARLPSLLDQRVRVRLEEDISLSTRGTVLEVETREGNAKYVILSPSPRPPPSRGLAWSFPRRIHRVSLSTGSMSGATCRVDLFSPAILS